jgi:hypothetical protein
MEFFLIRTLEKLPLFPSAFSEASIGQFFGQLPSNKGNKDREPYFLF